MHLLGVQHADGRQDRASQVLRETPSVRTHASPVEITDKYTTEPVHLEMVKTINGTCKFATIKKFLGKTKCW